MKKFSLNKKDVVVGLGEIGKPISKVLSKGIPVLGVDINPKLMNKTQLEKLKDLPVELLHICIPFNNKFQNNVSSLEKKYSPKAIVIHSTISPHTTEAIQKELKIPVIYSATRGIHKRMLKDIYRYKKFFSVYDWAKNSKWAIRIFDQRMKKCGIKTKKMSSPLSLELAKILVDTSYYGWLIAYAQLCNMIAVKNKINYDEMWSFSDEIHQYLGNRPKMFPGIIGGHCIIPNLELIQNDTLNLIKQINTDYAKSLKTKSTAKKN